MTEPPVPVTLPNAGLAPAKRLAGTRLPRPAAFPSLVAMGAAARLALALVAAGLLWLAVGWALGWGSA